MERQRQRETRKYIRAGTVAASIYNVNRDSRKRANAFTYSDIFPGIDKPESSDGSREATEAELDIFFRGVVKNFKKQASPRNGRTRRE